MNFNILRIPVTIHPSFLFLLLFFTGIYRELTFHNLFYCAIFAGSLLIHELGHAWAARYYGAWPTITLEGFGGVTSYQKTTTEHQSFIITLCGPLLEAVVLVLIPYLLLQTGYFKHTYTGYYLYLTKEINIFWLLFNLIPVEPLDGGKISHYILERIFGERGEKINNFIGLIAILICTPYYMLEGAYIFGGLLLFLGLQKMQTYYGGAKRDKSSPFSLFNKAKEHWENNEWEKAKHIFKKLSKSTDNFIKISSVEALATLLYNEKDYSSAYKLLLQHEDGLENHKPMLCKLAYEEGHFELIAKHSQEIYALEPTHEIALLNSKAFEKLNNSFLAEGWAQTASQFKQ